MNPPLERDLHAYADGRLAAGDAERVAAWLAEHPDDAARVSAWQRQNEWLHQLYDPLLDEAIPDRIDARLHRGWRDLLRPMAIAAGWLAVGGFIGFLAGQSPQPAEPTMARATPFHRQAAIAHVVYAPEVRHPVEVGAEQEAHLVNWLSKRLGQPLRVPHLSDTGYELVGGRLLPGGDGPVAQFMYEDASGARLTLYLAPPSANDSETSFRFAEEAGLGIFYWVDPRFSYALVADRPREALLRVAERVYRQFDQAALSHRDG